MEQYVTRIGDVTIQRVIPSGGGPPEPVRVMDGEELLRAVKEEPIDEDEEENEEESPVVGDEETPMEGDQEDDKVNEKEDPEEEEEVEEEDEDEEEKIIIKAEPQDQDELLGEDNESDQRPSEDANEDEQLDEAKEGEEEDDKSEKEKSDEYSEEKDKETGECSKRKADNDTEDDEESSSKKKKVEIDVDIDKKKISNLRRNIREVMDETQLDEATLSAQRQEAERLRRVQDQQKYIREVQRQIQLNRQNSKTQSRVISLLQGGSTSILKSSSVGSTTTATSTGPSTVLVKVGSGQQQVLNRKTLEVLRGGKSVSSSTEQVKSGISRVTTGAKPGMVTPSVSIAPVKPVFQGEAQKKVPPNDADIVTISSSDSDDDCIVISEGEEEEEEEEEEIDDDPTNSGMHTNDLYNIPDDQGRVLINVGRPDDEPDIFLAPQIARVIKPHQIGGVRFLFDNVVESLERFNNSTGFGCILAHSMGLGKTLQVVSFCDVFLRETSARTVMCIMPINTLQNWMAEFNMWLPTDPSNCPLAVHGEVRPRHFNIYVLNDLNKTIASRAKVVEEWYREGGVLLIGYEMYRQLSLKRAARVRKGKKKQVEEDVEDEKNKPLLEAMHEALVKPGPDLVICDEGHRIKNSHASISHALKQIRTKRRVVLTGYPLQNNLLEYWCMVDFVRPNYLGTKTEFSNMFERPIQNGQCIDSTPQDIRLMRYRAHVLHSLLEGFVQRRSHSVLRHSLPQKEEYVLLVRMTPLQRKLYDTFMNEVVRTKAVPNPLKAFAVCCKIWNHPDILYNFLKKKEMDELQDLDLEETAALQQQQTGPNSPRRPLAKEKRSKKEVKKAQVAPIKAEVTSQPQTQPQTPEVKQEERKFDFPNSGQSSGGGATGYDYYPPPPYPDPYHYQRPPYYPGYYQEGPPAATAAAGHPFYHHPPPPQGYDQPPAYPGGYYPNYEAPYPPKADDFGKGSWNSPPFSNPNVKQEKNQSKSPKEHEAPAKPGFQEFYSVKKEEKPDAKEEKQTFLCGFSGGQVSYNYRNYPGTGAYPNYPYPPSEYPGWNKGFPPFPPGDTVMQGTQGGNSGGTASGNQPGLFGGQNTSEVQQRANPNQERHHNMQPISQHSGSDRNSQSDSQSSSSSKDNQHKSHSGHERTQNPQDSMHGNYMNMHVKGNEHMKKQVPELLSSNNQNMYGNKKHDAGADPMQRNQDNTSKNRNTQESEAKNLQNVNHPPGQHNLFNAHETMRNQSQHYGNRNQQDDFRMAFSSPERPTTGSQNPHESSTLSPQVSKNSGHQQFSNAQAPPDNQQRLHHSSSEQNMTPNPYNNQRTDRGLRGAPEHLSNVASISLQSESDRMAGIHAGVYGNPENPLDHSNRPYGNQEHFSSNQKNIYGNKRNEHNLPSNQEHGSHQMGGQQMQDPPRRPSIGHDNIHPSPNMFNNQRSDNVVHGYQDHGQLSQQNSPVSHEKQEIRNRHHSSQEHHSGSQQMYVNQRNDNDNQLATPTSKHSGQHNMAMLPGQEHIQPNQQNLGMMSGPPHNAYGNQEVMQSNQHGMYRAPNQHDGQHRGSSGYYGNQFGHGMNSGQEAQNQQANLNQNQKAMSSGGDHSSGIQQNMYSNQSDHSVQKMIRNEQSHLESHQMMHSGQERPPNQYNIYPPPDTMYHNQHVNQGSHETSMQNPSEKQSAQDSQHNSPHMNRDRLNSQGAHSNQDRHSGAQAMFNNPNSDMHWHGLTERSGQQNIYDQSQQSKDDNTHKDKHQFHGNQDYSSHSQQNVYSGQSNQSLHRNAEIHGKHQGMMGHENQYRMVKDRSDRNPAMMSGIENKSNSQDSSSIPGSSHNRHNTSDHGILNTHENIQNSQNLHGSQHMQRNISHPSQEQIHNMMGNKSGSYGNSDHSHVGVNSQGVTTSLDGSQNVTGVQNYGLQNSPQQPHLGNQHNIHGNQSMNNQNANRNQHSSMNSIEQQSGSSHSHSDSQNMYSNQYHSQGDQHTMNNQNLHGNQHMKTHHSSQQSGQNIQQMYGNQMSQGSSSQSNNGGQGMSLPHQNQGMHPQNQNHSQNPHVSPMNQGHVSTQSNQGIPSSGQINQGQHGGQYPLHMNQPFPNSSQYQTSQTMHGNKDQSNAIPHNKGSPYQSSHHNNQYIQNLNQQSSTHNVHSDHMPGSQNTNKMAHNQHNLSNQAPLHNKSPTTPTKSDFQKLQNSPMSHLPPHHQQNVSQNQPVSQQGTQTAGDNAGQNSGSQHRIQNMLNFQSGGGPPYEQNIITSSKGMSGGQVLQGVQQQKHSMQNVLGNNDDQNRFRGNFNEPYPPNNDFQGNYQKPGFYGQDFNYGYQGQFPYQDKQFPEQPGPSGQTFRKEDDKASDENKTKETEKKSQHENDDNIKMNSTSTSTETEDDKEKKDKKDEEEKGGEKKPDGKPDSTTPQKSGKEDPGIPYDWATEILKGYVPGDISASAKMAVFFCILEESIALGDRILVFSQSLFTLNLMEELLQQQLVSGKEDERWAKNVNYYRLDGSTTAMEREKLINEFNSNANLHLFLVSTRAGSLGINLVGANRVIVFDASWNPCHDTQAVCRVYRYGQKKPCFVYRLVTDNCLEKKIYDRQINKQGMSDRVVDECNPDAHLSIKEVTSLCWDDKEDDDTPKDFTSLQDQYIDVVLQKVIQKHSIKLSKEPFAHESLLVDRKEKKLSSAEKRLAKRSYELEKQASARPMYNGINQNQVRPKPMASVRPMQAEMGQAGRQRGWIPASVWQRQGMSAQEMTLPLDVVIPTNSADRASIVLKAGQKVMVLKSPKGIYMQLENGKIIAIRTAFKVGGKKPGEQQGKVGPAELVQRRGLRQIGATRGRPIRAVGPVTRPPPVSVTLTKKRLSEDEQAGRKEDESESSESSQPTPMEVSEVSSTEKECKGDGDAPNPFTAAAAASLSTMQVSHSEDGQKHMDSMEQSSQLNEKQSTSPNPVHSQQLTTQLQNPPTPVPIQPQVPMSPQPPQASVQPLPAKPIANHPQVTVQPIVQNPVQTQVSPAQAPVKIQPANQKPTQLPVQPQTPTTVLPQHQQSVSIPMETQPSVPTRSPMHMQQPVQPQSAYPNPAQVSILPSVAPHPQPLSHPPMQAHPPTSQTPTSVPLQTHTQAASPLIAHPQVSTSIQTHGLASAQHPLASSASIPQQGLPSTSNPSQSHSHSSSIQTQTQTSPNVQSLVQTSSSIQTHPQVPSPMHPQPPLSLHPHYPIPSHPQAPFPMQQQAPHHPHSSPYSMQSQQQKQSHFPSLPPHQFPLPPQQGQYPMPPQQSQFLGHPTHQTFPMHPQPQYPIHPQQPYPVQPQPQYPLQPHLQQPQYPGQPPHQFPLHPQSQYPLQPSSQFDPSSPVPSSMMTDHLS